MLCLHIVALNIDFSSFDMLGFLRGPHVERQIWQDNISTRIPMKRLKIFWYLDVHSGCYHLESWLSVNTGLELIVFSKNRHRENSILSCKWRIGNSRPQMKTDFPLIFRLGLPAKQLLEELLRFNQYLIIIAFVQLTFLWKQTRWPLNKRQDNGWISYIYYGFPLILKSIF